MEKRKANKTERFGGILICGVNFGEDLFLPKKQICITYFNWGMEQKFKKKLKYITFEWEKLWRIKVWKMMLLDIILNQ